MSLSAPSGPARAADLVADAANAMPQRPGIPVAYVDGQKVPIVGYRGRNPVVMLNGKRTTERGAPVSIVPGTRFGEGYVKIKKAGTMLETQTLDINGSKTQHGYTVFGGTLTSDTELADAYMLLLVYEDSGGAYQAAPKVAILGIDLGRLEPGKPRTVDEDFPMVTSDKRLAWTALVFSGTSAIHSSEGNAGLDRLFDIVDHIVLDRVIAQRNTGDHPPMVFRQFPLRLQGGYRASLAGQTVKLRIKITPEGFFDFLENDEGADRELVNEVASQLRFWLFVPKITNGIPEEGAIVMPLKF